MSGVFKLNAEIENRERSPRKINNPVRIQAVNLSGKLPEIKADLWQGVSTYALLDSGSSRSLISREFFNKIKTLPCVKSVAKVNCAIQTANRDRLAVKIEAKVHIKIEKFSWNFDFWIVSRLPYSMVIGYDFMKATQMRLDLSKNEVMFSFAENDVPISCIAIESDSDPDSVKIDDSPLTAEQKEQFDQLINSFGDVITQRVGRARCKPYEIKLVGTPNPVRCRPYQVNPEGMRAMRGIIQDMLDQDIIERSNSEWSSPAFLRPKRDQGKFRLVCNYKRLNDQIRVDPFPMPVTDTLFQYLLNSKVYSSIDLLQAYHQVPISDASRPLTGFNTPFGHFNYKVIPQGCKIGSQALGRLVEEVFSDLQYKCLLIYADDLIIFSDSPENHLRDLKEVLTRLRSVNLTVNPDKISLAKNGVQFLGFLIKDNKIHIDPSRTEALRNFPVPKNVKQVQRFLGICSYFGKFVKSFSELSCELNKLKRKGQRWKWTDKCAESFVKLKQALTTPPCLHLPDYSKKFILSVDASDFCVGAVLEQVVDGKPAPIAYASRTLTRSELGYSVFAKEFLAALFGCEKFKAIIQDHRFLLRSDCQAIFHVMKSDKQTGQMARWKLRLSTFNFDLEHCRATMNVCADSLSRMFEGDPLNCNNTEGDKTLTSPEKCLILQNFPTFFQSIAENQNSDPRLSEIICKLEQGEDVPHYQLRGGVLKYQKNPRCPAKVVVPENMHQVVAKYYHDAEINCHLGLKKTLAKISRDLAWDGMFQYVRDYVRSCKVCQLSKPAQNQKYGEMMSKPPERIFERLHIDIFGPLPRSTNGNVYILVAIDTFSKFSFIRPIRKSTTEAIIKELKEHIFSQHGLPEMIVSDNASYFTSDKFRAFCFGLGIKHVKTSVNWAKSNHSERVNRNLKYALKIYHSEAQQKWDQLLPYLQVGFNSAVHESHGKSPSYVLMGRELNHPLKLLWNLGDEEFEPSTDAEERIRHIARELKATHAKTKVRYDRGRQPSPFVVNSKVMYRRTVLSNKAKKISSKLSQNWTGPWVVLEVLSPVNVKIKRESDPCQQRVVHVAQLKKYYTRESESE